MSEAIRAERIEADAAPEPHNECDECRQPLGADEGGLCVVCAWRYEQEQKREWWE